MFKPKSLQLPSQSRVFARLSLITAAFSVVCVCQAARADIIYSFASTTAAPGFGALSGSFTVLDSAISDGVIDAAEITTYSFADLIYTFAPPPGVFAASVLVDSTTGALQNVGALTLFETDGDAPFPFEAATFVTGTGSQAYVRVGDAPNFTGAGFGEWTVRQTAIPEPGSVALCAALGFGWVLLRRRKKAIV